jgi:hypothetical protein
VTGYRLRPLQDQRARDERVVRGELADAVGEVRGADARLVAASARVAELREAIGLAQPTTTIADFARVERYRSRLRGQLELALVDELRAREARDGVASAAELACDRLVLARAARRAVEAHFERWRTEQRKLAERRED